MAVAISVAAALQAEAETGLVALARACMVGVPVAVGLYAWYARLNERFGLLLVAAGAGWFLTTLAESSDTTLYTIGRTAGWLAEVLLVYLFLSFPTGRLTARVDRALVAAIGAIVLVLFLPRLLLAPTFELPSAYTSCVHDCPADALAVLDREPALLDAVVRPLGLALLLAVAVFVALRLRWRERAATPLARRALGPVTAIAMLRAGLLAVVVVAAHVEPGSWLQRGSLWLLALMVPLVALAFLVGLVRWRLYTGRALERLAACLRAKPDAATLQRAFAEAFEDPSVRILFPDLRASGERWLDSRGHAVSSPSPDSGTTLSRLEQERRTVAAIVHDATLDADPALRAGLVMAGVALENQRLVTEAEVAMREVKASRARIATSGERERRRIEQDLHDGAQQRLVALRIELELAEELVRRDPEGGVERLRRLEQDVDDALEELRGLAHGVYPPLLADRGLPEALQAVARRSAVPVHLRVRRTDRYGPEVESAVYYCVLEALQNVLKHARSALRVDVELDGGVAGELRLRVEDDGPGFAPADEERGAGITNMRDRLVALGGEMELSSTPGVGTRVWGWVPTDDRVREVAG